ncbi:hypothetical protein [Virgisporangium aurantiacum]|uniref:Uncharacterized protein n=1 Tax=Virgisporangium aurantiacum TaxID=175570 RepID=A0A8J3ZBA7_9ACTN|nr:hypothetical protein [Virgisporangium aurantiacum]GIJ58535.1 hypothetical protein Vau01_060510 [Virgisporangium aurantiacum]
MYDRGPLIAWLLTPLVLILGVWLVWYAGAGIFTGGEWAAHQHFWTGLERYFFPGGLNPLRWTGWGYLMVIAWLIAGVGALAASGVDFEEVGIVGLVLAMLFCGVMFFVAVVGNGMDEARGYDGTATSPTTVFVVRDPGNAPSFVRDLTADAEPASGGPCVLLGRHDVVGCVDRGELSVNWEPRVVSIAAAKYQMKTNSASVANTELRENTAGYLYRRGEDGALQVKVSAVRDGKDDRPLHSVVEWDGRGNPTSCLFAGGYAIDTSFNGTHSRNLRDLLADRYPDLLYDDEDVWGYCDGDQPKVVVPVVRQVDYRNRTVLRPAGVLVVSGKNGKTHLDHLRTVAPDDLPGPSYPITMVIKQREMSAWAAGKSPDDDGGFGFELTGAGTQQDNIGVYQLLSKEDGRRYWVSPLRARGSDSEQLVAYAVTPADTVTAGSFNTQRIYVLDDGDERITALTRLENRIKAVLASDPGFYPAGGRVIEFLPLDGRTWQAYGELDGQVKYLFTVPVDESKPVTVANLLTGGQATTPPTNQPGDGAAASPCADFARATREQLRDCAFRALEEDRRRAAAEAAGQTAPPDLPASQPASPSPSSSGR